MAPLSGSDNAVNRKSRLFPIFSHSISTFLFRILPSKKGSFVGVIRSMSYNSTLAQIGFIVDSDQSVNPISTPSTSLNTSMTSEERSDNGDNELYRIRPLREYLTP